MQETGHLEILTFVFFVYFQSFKIKHIQTERQIKVHK